MAPFHSSDNKRIVRRAWDYPILLEDSNSRGRSLSYFGMPGGDIEDLTDWAGVLGKRTAVQRLRAGNPKHAMEDRLTIHRIMTNVSTRHLPGGRLMAEDFELRRGLVEDLIIEGRDQDGVYPFLSDGHRHELFRYDVYNLDFEGGWFVDDHKDAKRSKMLTALFERQAGHDFTLVMTLGVRNTADSWMIDYVRARVGEVDADAATFLAWLTDAGPHKIFLWSLYGFPLFIKREAEHARFSCHSYPPVTYVGTGSTRMIHFVLRMRSTETPFHAVSNQTDVDVLRLPIVEAADGSLRAFASQSPLSTRASCTAQLGFLDKEVSAVIIAGLGDAVAA